MKMTIILLLVFHVSVSAQMLMQPTQGRSGLQTVYSIDTSQNLLRGNRQFPSSIWYDSTKNQTIIGGRADSDSAYTALIYVFSHGVNDGFLIDTIKVNSTPDNHQRPVFWQAAGSLFFARAFIHNSPFQVYKGNADSFNSLGNFGAGIGYPQPYILNDTICIAGRYTVDRKYRNYKGTPTGGSYTFDMDIAGPVPEGNQPYPGVYPDWIDNTIIYHSINTRNFGVGINEINYFELFLIKANDFDTLWNVDKSHFSTSTIAYDTLNTYYEIKQATDTITQEVRPMGGYVDADDGLHLVYVNTDTDSIVFLRVEGDSYTEKNIPISSMFQNPGTEPINIVAVDDYIELVHKGGNRYDIFIFNEGLGVTMYSTEDAFNSLSNTIQISTDNLTPVAMRGTANYRPGSGWPYILAIACNRSDGNEFLQLYEYYPR